MVNSDCSRRSGEDRVEPSLADPVWSDRAENVMFNSFPAALTPDLKALHNLTAPNMVQPDPGNKSPGIQNGGTMLSYSPFGV